MDPREQLTCVYLTTNLLSYGVYLIQDDEEKHEGLKKIC